MKFLCFFTPPKYRPDRGQVAIWSAKRGAKLSTHILYITDTAKKQSLNELLRHWKRFAHGLHFFLQLGFLGCVVLGSHCFDHDFG